MTDTKQQPTARRTNHSTRVARVGVLLGAGCAAAGHYLMHLMAWEYLIGLAHALGGVEYSGMSWGGKCFLASASGAWAGAFALRTLRPGRWISPALGVVSLLVWAPILVLPLLVGYEAWLLLPGLVTALWFLWPGDPGARGWLRFRRWNPVWAGLGLLLYGYAATGPVRTMAQEHRRAAMIAEVFRPTVEDSVGGLLANLNKGKGREHTVEQEILLDTDTEPGPDYAIYLLKRNGLYVGNLRFSKNQWGWQCVGSSGFPAQSERPTPQPTPWPRRTATRDAEAEEGTDGGHSKR